MFPSASQPPALSHIPGRTYTRIPQRIYKSTSRAPPPPARQSPCRCIEFHRAGESQPGMSLKELLGRSGYSLMYGAREAVFNKSGLVQVKLRVLWPGYDHVDWVRRIELQTAYGPMTRGQLAQAVASHLVKYFEEFQNQPIQPKDARWRLSPQVLDRLAVASVWNVCEDTWMAEFLLE
ncbi:hypothetical protein BD410DRAFT_834972 [Rickenella mellea]|uniref:Uncharacterized protein n=1 Tax=Rickenella mellea TaxID=50990 RepID=A0A4Y7QNJ1_9AGAM|nr:hypothetical protein BD410DRAFT_834972 [Rickenella mellea]